MKAIRNGGSESVWTPPLVDAAEDMDSSHGRAIAAPTPRKRVRREIGLIIEKFFPSD
jgi:hypothetical protein